MEPDGDHEQELIQQQMEETRASLSDKLDALENQVADTVQTATDVVQNTKEAVAETVESVKETVGEITDRVGDTMRSVARTFDITHQAQERPWVLFGGAIGVGWLLGWYLPSGGNRQKKPAAERSFAETPAPPPPRSVAAAPAAAQEPGWVSNQLGRLRALAIGTVMGTIRDLAKQNLSDAISARVAEEVDNLTPHLGGEVIHRQILPDPKPDPKPDPEATPAAGRPAPGIRPVPIPTGDGEKGRGRYRASERIDGHMA